VNESDECPACSSPEFRILFHATDRLYRTTTRQFAVVECANCRLIRLHPWPSEDELRKYYPEEYWFAPTGSAASRLEELYRRIVLRDHVRFVREALERSGEKGPVLDAGCGGGLFLRLLAEAGAAVAGLDLSARAATIAWRVNGVPAIAGLLSKSPIAPGSCAAVTMFHVLEHLYDPASYIASAHEILRPNGRLIVQVPNAACWQFRLFGSAWNGMDVPRHLINFKESDIDCLLDSCGFEPVRHKHFSLRDNPAGLASTIAPGLDPMARRIRPGAESATTRLLKDLVYMGLVTASTPFTLLEAACRSGSTIMVEARKKR
jgi:SAM-dependent methyltransferase